MNAGTLEIVAQALCLQHRGGLGQSDDDEFRLALVAQSGQQPSDGYGRVALAVGYLPVVALCGVEQEQGMTRGGCVDDNCLVVGLHHDLGKAAEDGNLLGAGAAQVFLDVGEVGHASLACFLSYLILICLQHVLLIDDSHLNAGLQG